MSPAGVAAGESSARLLDSVLESVTQWFPTQSPQQQYEQCFVLDPVLEEDAYFEMSLRMLRDVVDRNKGHPLRTSLQ